MTCRSMRGRRPDDVRHVGGWMRGNSDGAPNNGLQPTVGALLLRAARSTRALRAAGG